MDSNNALTNQDRAVARGKRLEYFTIAWNSLEGLIALFAGFLAGSVALVGFGFDSAIEVTSGAALLWRLHRGERAERATLRIVGASFILLALYVAYDSAHTLWSRETPGRSVTGIALTAVSIVVMPLLARAKRQAAASLASGAMRADARQTEFCMYLSAIVLGGLLLNALLGWWWADPLAGLAMVPIIGKEGIDALRGKACCGDDGCHGSGTLQ
jgi:divalent metal cation (Fe/Co/Zn/Cd) transporter